jgi:hypothetical protein
VSLEEIQSIINAIKNLMDLTYCTSLSQDVIDEYLMDAEFAMLILEREKVT